MVKNDMRAEDGSKNLVGPRVRALRQKAGLSQEELMVSDLEVRLLARYFKVSYEYLIDGTN